MSVTGLIIALGLLIDNAIVMVDEVQHRLDVGAPPAEAIAGAVRHLAVPLGSSTLTTALAFMPMILMAGPAGEFVGGIGLSVILALTASLFLALTVIPSVFARGTSPERGRPGGAGGSPCPRRRAPCGGCSTGWSPDPCAASRSAVCSRWSGSSRRSACPSSSSRPPTATNCR